MSSVCSQAIKPAVQHYHATLAAMTHVQLLKFAGNGTVTVQQQLILRDSTITTVDADLHLLPAFKKDIVLEPKNGSIRFNGPLLQAGGAGGTGGPLNS